MINLIELGVQTELPPVIVIPGIDGTIGSVEPVVSNLAHHRKVIVADYSGEDNPTLDSLGAELTEACSALPLEEFDLLGQSIGTVLTAAVAGDLHQRIRRVALMCTFTRLRWGILRVSTFMMRLTPDWLYRLTTVPLMAGVCGPVGDGWDHPFFAASKSAEKEAITKRTAWQIDRDFTPELKSITSPLLILMGEKDRFVPDAEEEIAKLTRLFIDQNAEVLTIPEAGHVFLPTPAIRQAAELLKEFYQ